VGITVAFESKVPHTTPWLSIEWEIDKDDPQELIEALAEIGWAEDPRYRRVPPIHNMQELNLNPPSGSGLFGEWTDEERRQRMPVVRRVLRDKGFKDVPWNQLTLADLL
jgi:hypothetical protein